MGTLDLHELLRTVVEAEHRVRFLVGYFTVDVRCRGLVGAVRLTQQAAGDSILLHGYWLAVRPRHSNNDSRTIRVLDTRFQNKGVRVVNTSPIIDIT